VPFLEVAMVQVREVIRRWQAGESKTAIGRASGISRRTVGRYVAAAETLGVVQDGEPPGEGVLAALLRRNHAGPLPLRPTLTAERLAGHEERVARWLQDDDLQLTRIHELLQRDGVAVSYTALRRYVRETGLWKAAKTTVRMAEWPPGEVAELDFGRLGVLVDATTGKKQVIWALAVVLPYSRHSFVWPLLRQTLEESIVGLEAAWRFFGGVPKRVILDNFPAAIAGPDVLAPRPTRLSRVQPGARLLHRSRPRAQAPGQALRRAQHPVRTRALL
jgi:transposase